MSSVSRPVPLRWVYPIIGAVVAGVGAALYALDAQPLIISLVATVLFVAVGRFLGQRWDTLRETAITDPLTGVANRRQFDQRLSKAISEATRGGIPLTLLFVDVDHLKAVNDQLGHSAGDAALKLVGETLARTCRSRDLVARWGGDEFAVLAMWTTSREGMILGQRIRATLARLSKQAEAFLCPTVSIGVAELGQVGWARADALLGAADDALYRAKMAGRDRVVLASPEEEPRRRRPKMANLRTRPLRLSQDASTTHH